MTVYTLRPVSPKEQVVFELRALALQLAEGEDTYALMRGNVARRLRELADVMEKWEERQR